MFMRFFGDAVGHQRQGDVPVPVTDLPAVVDEDDYANDPVAEPQRMQPLPDDPEPAWFKADLECWPTYLAGNTAAVHLYVVRALDCWPQPARDAAGREVGDDSGPGRNEEVSWCVMSYTRRWLV